MYGHTIRQHRQNKKYTQEYMAEQLGISQNAYFKIETDQTKLKVDVLNQIAKVLEVDPSELLNASGEKYSINQSSYDNSQGVVIQEHNFDAERTLWQQLERDLRETIATQKLLIESLRPAPGK